MFKKNLAQMCVIVRNIDLSMRICYDFSTAVSKKNVIFIQKPKNTDMRKWSGVFTENLQVERRRK